jgi:putative transposase
LRPDHHAHLQVSLPPQIALSEFVNALKTNTARVLRRDFWPERRHWYSERVLRSRSDCVLSIRAAPPAVLKRYIEQQGRPA